MSQLRMLLPGTAVVGDLRAGRADAVQALADLYAYPVPVPVTGWVRASLVSTLDGAVAGADGRAGSIATAPDRAVSGVLRGLADVILVGAGTVRAEGYRLPAADPDFAERRAAAGQAPAPRLAIVTVSGDLGNAGADLGGPDGPYLVTTAGAQLDRLRALAGADRVLVAGEDRVDPRLAVAHLAARGLRRILLEGGPHLLGDVLAADCLDEICLAHSPLLTGGGALRGAVGSGTALRLRPAHLVECEATLLGRWLVHRP
ncbi:MAG TPA: dihydrofolate reductase family protein [Kineosporiaceae bacterium]|nr:dihydrofolate reductase family protein [Kineosporiaceae bacterium]